MAYSVIMPKQGLLMVEGTIIKWLAKEGGRVEEGKPLFEMETDKLTITMDSPASGTLLKIIKGEGEIVPITELIAVIGEPGEDISKLLDESHKDEAAAVSKVNTPSAKALETNKPIAVVTNSVKRVFITPRAKTLAGDDDIDINDIEGTGPDGLVVERDVEKYISDSKTRKKITPLAKKVAVLNDVNLAEIKGTGANGKVIRADVEDVIAGRNKKSASTKKVNKVIPFKGMRKIISDKMMQSLHGMAQGNHRMHVDMSEVIRFRENLKAENIKVSFNDIMVKVVSKALIDYPMMNSSLTEEGILLRNYVNMGLAVAVDNGLIVPVLKDADVLSLKEISNVSAELIDKAKTGKLLPDDYADGTFTITNLGMFDIDEFTPIINPPEVGILGIGKITKTPVVEGENIVIKPIMVLSLTYDHRVVDGAPAAQFLQRVKQILQNPYLLI